MLSYALTAVAELAARQRVAEVVCVVGHKASDVREAFAAWQAPYPLSWVEQVEQLGTGHAVRTAAPHLAGFGGDVLILCADTPLLRSATLDGLILAHRASGAALSLLSVVLPEPGGYGRVIRDAAGEPERIVEARDCTPEQRRISEVNTGIYCVAAPFLAEAVAGLTNDNAQGEYYLTDIAQAARAQGLGISATRVPDADEVMGINDRAELARAAAVLRGRILRRLMLSGVSVIDPTNTYIEADVEVGPDTTVFPGATICGRTRIGAGCRVESWVSIRDCVIDDGARILHGSHCDGAHVGHEARVGPFARLRPGADLAERVSVGNFVEVKKSQIGAGSKVNHLTYIGDATIGRDVNVGAGTITCNYDGVNKHRTIIGDRAFIGSNAQFVAPVEVGADALIGAGSTITQDVPPGMMAIGRGRQVNLPRKPRKQKASS
jgi:bifunctional UDP-N-acetylglucosamine pyrophosphorylase/glucosamine-1-phosphate N-acetyltransferase